MFFEGTIIYHLGMVEPLAGNDWWLWSFWLTAVCGLWAMANAKTWPLQRLMITGGAFLITFAVFFLSGLIQPNYVNPRHFMVLSIPYFLLICAGLGWLYGRWAPLGWLALALLSTLAINILAPSMITPPQTKDDIRSLATLLEAQAQAGDLVVWHDASHSATYDFYAVPDLPYIAYPPLFVAQDVNLEEDYQRVLAAYGAERIWFVDTENTRLDTTQEWMEAHWWGQAFHVFEGSWTGIYLTLYTRPESLDIPEQTIATSGAFLLHSVSSPIRAESGA